MLAEPSLLCKILLLSHHHQKPGKVCLVPNSKKFYDRIFLYDFFHYMMDSINNWLK